MLKFIVLLMFFGLSLNTNAFEVDQSKLNRFNEADDSNLWLNEFKRKTEALVGESADSFFQRISHTNHSWVSLFRSLNEDYEEKYENNLDSAPDKPLGAFLKPLVTYDKRAIGYSQLVYETAMACALSAAGTTWRERTCKSYPKIFLAVSQIILSNTHQPYSTYSSYDKFANRKSEVSPDRGAVLSRAFAPIYLSRKIQGSHVHSTANRPSDYSSKMNAILDRYEQIVNGSLKDFYLRMMMNFNIGRSNQSGIFNGFKNNYSSLDAIEDCISERNRRGQSGDKRCTSNHAIAMFLGRLMVNDLQGDRLNESKSEFIEVVRHSIETRNGFYTMTDRFRTFDIKNGSANPSGIGYSFLQLRLIVFAAENLINAPNSNDRINLYSIFNQKLLEAIDFASHVSNIKINASDVFFDAGTNGSSAVFHEKELGKYINHSEGSASNVERARLKWAKNHGFLLIPRKRFCNSSSRRSRYSYLCMTKDNYNRTRFMRNSIPAHVNEVSDLIEDGYVGPVQFLLYNY